MKAIGSIYLTWRKGKGSRRVIVGKIQRSASKGVQFHYIQTGVAKAKEEGFTPYVDFPDTTKVYTEKVLDIFGQRLIKTERSDIQKYLDFWNISKEYQNDKFYLLAYTQGMLSTDNFEFLADFHPVKDLRFVSEICGHSYFEVTPGQLSVNDILTYKLEKDNTKDRYAVKLFKGPKAIGYVKLVHSRVFHKKAKLPLTVRVKSIDQNGKVNRVFIDIFY
ncbi:hypothetical protein [Geofilum rubicundum]|uniref:HIRAN domain-containing protein n=1 Tax=Geofilum rubicundum JCM 15548 TaxID=1236989 RepID=A0A0E9M019_9BACT|nr:hypothetical protein [Geofilum rubicundum]GAO30455.1 hypothetical protein JCM15548_12724 [Geofilum rubicundum JCM 15548]